MSVGLAACSSAGSSQGGGSASGGSAPSGTLTIDNSTLSDNPSGAFQNAPGIFDDVNSVVTQPTESGSSVS